MGEQEPSVRGEYEGAELGDRRLNARLQTIAEALEAKPDAGFPNAMTEAELEAFYRFLSNDRVDADRVLAPHVEATVGRCAGRDTVLCVQDTTVFKFGTPREGLGEYAGQTLFGHIAMAVGLDGVALGVVGLSPWARGNDTVRQRRLRGEKIPHGADGWPNEQDRWMSTVEQTEGVFEDGPSLIHVMDSEDDGPNKLREFVSSSPIVCTREVHLSKRAKTRFRVNTKQKLPRQSRQATLSIGAGAVQLRAPQYYRKKVAHPLALKTGCAYEKRQLGSYQTLVNALALLLPIAWNLLRLMILHTSKCRSISIGEKGVLLPSPHCDLPK